MVRVDGDGPARAEPTSVAGLLQARAASAGERVAYTFLADDGTESARVTYAGLDARARAVAADLAARGVGPGRTAMLTFTPGPALLEAFFGCLYAGVVAVPTAPVTRDGAPVHAIARVAAPAVGLTNLPHASLPELPGGWFSPGDVADGAVWTGPTIRREDLAFLQFTSGSTAAPRGVVVSHGNLLANLATIHRLFGCTPESHAVSWLPPHHDMGLIGGILEPLYGGFPCTLLSPMAFLRRPVLWLRTISRVRGTMSGGPNFAYELLLQRVAPEDRVGLDLSSWSVAFDGAEPVRAATLERFARAFAPFGLRPGALYPCYGLAESTLLATGADAGTPHVRLSVDGPALDAGEARPPSDERRGEGRVLVGSGRPAPGSHLAIVRDGVRCAPGQVGEIWLRGPSVAAGYWSDPVATEETFGAVLDGERWLRTGDLGFLHDGALFVTGRAKDLVILRGRNHYPQDIEASAEGAHASVAGAAAFAYEAEGEERLAVACEIGRRTNPDVDALARAVRAAVSRDHGADVHAVIVVPPARLPRTTSGKVPRRACREAWLSGELPRVGESARGPVLLPVGETASLEVAVRSRIAALLGVPEREVDLDAPVGALGLGSLNAMTLKAWLEDEHGRSVPIEAFFQDVPARALLVGTSADAPVPPPPARPNVVAVTTPVRVATSHRSGEPGEVDALLAWLRGYGATRINARLMDERRSIPPGVVLDFGNRGLFGLQVPRALGGLGLGTRDTLRVIEQIAAIDLGLALMVGVHAALGTIPILRHAPAELRDALVPMLAAGRTLASFALSEPGAGSNPRALTTTATPDGRGGWVLRGTKAWVGSAAWAGVIHVFASQRDMDGRTVGISAFAVPGDAPGLRVGPEALTMGMRATVQSRVTLDGVRVDATRLLGAPGMGMAVAQEALDAGRLGIVAMSLGAMRRCFQLATRYGERRNVATGRLLDTPAARARLAEMAAAIEALDALATTVATRLDSGEPVPEELYLACKIAGPELLWEAADATVQMLGARGYTEPNVAPRILRDARALRIFEGPTEAVALHLGERIARSPGLVGGERLAEATRALRGVDDPRRVATTLGMLATWSLVAELSRDRDPRVARWAEARFDRALRDAAPPADPPLDLLAACAERVGDFAPDGPDEDRALDPLLATGAAARDPVPPSAPLWRSAGEIPDEARRVERFPEVTQVARLLGDLPVPNPYFAAHEDGNGARTRLDGHVLVNFSGYDYLGLAGHPDVRAAATDAIARHGTSVSASRLTSGQIPLHRALEKALAGLLRVEDAVVMSAGYGTNTTTVASLLGERDVLFHDALVHRSVLDGGALAGATRIAFPHGDWRALDALLAEHRLRHRRALVVIEGVYSMDGDVPDLAAFVAVKERHGALLMVDEAHSVGVLGATGRGLAEHAGVDPARVDVWMGTLSKALASCGGYVAGSGALVEWLRYSAPGFVYSAGISPANTAAALAAVRRLVAEPERVARLRDRSATLLALARERGFDVGTSGGSAIVPVVLGGSERCLRAAHALRDAGFHVMPIVFPAVAEDAARLRFFVNADHTDAELRAAMDALADALAPRRPSAPPPPEVAASPAGPPRSEVPTAPTAPVPAFVGRDPPRRPETSARRRLLRWLVERVRDR